MPFTKNVSANMRELYADNKKKGKAKGANGKVRSRAQMIAMAMSAAGKSKDKEVSPMKELAMKMRASKHKS